MESLYGDLPAPLAAARRIGWVRYADFEDLRAGRTREVAARVAKRVRRGRVVLVLAALVALPAGLLSAFWTGCLTGAFYLGLTLLIRDLDALAAGA